MQLSDGAARGTLRATARHKHSRHASQRRPLPHGCTRLASQPQSRCLEVSTASRTLKRARKHAPMTGDGREGTGTTHLCLWKCRVSCETRMPAGRQAPARCRRARASQSTRQSASKSLPVTDKMDRFEFRSSKRGLLSKCALFDATVASMRAGDAPNTLSLLAFLETSGKRRPAQWRSKGP